MPSVDCKSAPLGQEVRFRPRPTSLDALVLMRIKQFIELILSIFHAGFDHYPHLLALGNYEAVDHYGWAICGIHSGHPATRRHVIAIALVGNERGL